MFRSIGLPELLVILVVLLVFLFMPLVWGKIFSKAGYSGWLGLLMLIPVISLIALCWFALADWPVLSELAHLRRSTARTLPGTQN